MIHSLLASLICKRWVADHWPTLLPKYRLIFNIIATGLLVPPVSLTFLWQGPLLWEWSGVSGWFANGLAIAACAGFVGTLHGYDMAEFTGLRQLRQSTKTVLDQESFHISFLHRFVRHPWYSLTLVIIWTRPMDMALLTTASLISLYFVVGSKLEEAKLLVYHGAVYERYRERVPRLIPLPWKYLNHAEATEIMTSVKNFP